VGPSWELNSISSKIDDDQQSKQERVLRDDSPQKEDSEGESVRTTKEGCREAETASRRLEFDDLESLEVRVPTRRHGDISDLRRGDTTKPGTDAIAEAIRGTRRSPARSRGAMVIPTRQWEGACGHSQWRGGEGEPEHRVGWGQERFAQVAVDALDGEEEQYDGNVPDAGVTTALEEVRVDRALDRARTRNDLRIRLANERDLAIVGKYLPSDIECFFPPALRLVGPDDFGRPSATWLERIREVVATDCIIPRKPAFRFDTSRSSIEENRSLLAGADWDMEKLMSSQKNTTAWHGSEFRPVSQLRQILRDHPSFEYIEKILTMGMEYECTHELSEGERVLEMRAQLERGNHKSAAGKSDNLKALLEKDVSHGFSLPLPAEAVHRIVDAMVQPCGMVSQSSLQADGSRKTKDRLTHDLSFSCAVPNSSVNDRIDMARYPELVYGWCMIRLIHFVVCLRLSEPQTKIYIMKFDYSDAYRRISYAGRAAAQSILVVEEVAYLALRLAFGGSPNPACWCAISETITDMANDLSCSAWDPTDLVSPTVLSEHLTPRDYDDEGEVPSLAMAPAFEIPTSLQSRKDCFVDDIVCVFLDTEENRKREGHSVPLAVHAVSRPHQGDDQEPIRRRPILSPEKLEAEGRPSEVMIVLGWEVNTRRLEVSLPENKYISWANDLCNAIKNTGMSSEELESLIGRLNHASFLVPLSRHFLGDLRKRIKKGRWMRKRMVRLSTNELDDLGLWQGFLRKAREGISMNLLTVRMPTLIGWSDSCPFGLGGFTLEGKAWRLKIPKRSPIYGDDRANNALEFLGMAINILLMLNQGEDNRFPCLLALGDNTSAIGWIFRSGQIPRESLYFHTVKMIARKIAWEAIETGAQIMSQHFKGTKNIIADLLSFAGDERGKTHTLTVDNPPDSVLTQRILVHYPQLVPQCFEISHLPDEIRSFACAAIRTLEDSWIRSKKERSRRRKKCGDDGSATSKDWDLSTASSMEYPRTSERSWPDVSLSTTETQSSMTREELLGDVRNRLWNRLSEMPLGIWQRRFGQTTGRVPSTSRAGQQAARPYASR